MLCATIETKTAEKLICFLLGSGDHILEDVAVKERELFISDATDVYPASALRWLVTKKQSFYMPGLCLTRWIGWKLFCGQLYWWSRWLILTSFTQVSDKLPSNVAIKKMCNGGDFHMLPAIFDSPVNKHLVVPSNVLLTISLGNKTINVWDLQWI